MDCLKEYSLGEVVCIIQHAIDKESTSSNVDGFVWLIENERSHSSCRRVYYRLQYARSEMSRVNYAEDQVNNPIDI